MDPTASAYINSLGSVINVDATDISIFWDVTLSTVLNSLKLYISGTSLQLTDADANDFVTSTLVWGYNDGTGALLDNDGTNKQAKGTFDNTFGAVDCSGYDSVLVQCVVTATDADAFEMMSCAVQAYYDT